MKILNLFWHNILPDTLAEESFAGSDSTTSMFRKQLQYIANAYSPISINDFLEVADKPELARAFKKPPIILGFDDGFRNVMTEALPILNEFKIPAVFFVIGEILKNEEFVPWFIELKHLLRRSKRNAIYFRQAEVNLASPQDRRRLLRSFEASLRACRAEGQRQQLLQDLADRLGVARPVASDLDEDLRFVTKADLASLEPSSLLTIASHAMTHRHLDCLTPEEQIAELHESDSLLRKYSASYCPVISYPSGSFSDGTVAIAQRIYRAGFAVFLKSSYRNRYGYPRIGINDASVDDLAYILSPFRLNYLLPLKRFLHVTGIRTA